MSEWPAAVTNSHLWKTTLAKRDDDVYGTERERLKAALTAFRDQAALLAIEIGRDLPELTVHDISHLDSLWETASIIAGNDYKLTPTEGFVFGGAILLHDLGMSLAAVDGGLKALKNDPRWADLVTHEYRNTFLRNPSASEIENPSECVQRAVLFNLLRQTHAANAEKLAFMSFKSSDDSSCLHLMDDTELRQSFGKLMGQVAHSHWWSVLEVEKIFSRPMGPPHWCPPNWTTDPLKAACLLRVADASQIDSARAPLLLKAVTHLSEESDVHWTFQGKLNKPYLNDDSLVFTSGHGFRLGEASAWWKCFETLKVVDRELASVDSLFADKGYQRYAARRVAGIDSPERLVSYIQTDGWLPINATIHVTDLPQVIASVGGEELYGKHPEVALRELIQNACDAIHARRVYEKRGNDFGTIEVILIEKGKDEHWLQVSDNGIGMSQRVLTDFLLDFGRSFWGSSEMQQEFPGLLSSGIRQIGKYGIGFFSVFMIADEVQVITRRSDAAARDTLILEFSSGPKGRPILRRAQSDVQLIDGGTCVKVRLRKPPFEKGGLFFSPETDKPIALSKLCTELCPTLAVDLSIVEDGQVRRLIKGDDWKTISNVEFARRIPVTSRLDMIDEEDQAAFRDRAANNLRLLYDVNGEVIGRAMISGGFRIGDHRYLLEGVITTGGLRTCPLHGISGALAGTPVRAARDVAIPIVSDIELKRWAEEQIDLIPNLSENPEFLESCAQIIRLCSGDTRSLPICINKDTWCSAQDIAGSADLPREVIIADHRDVDRFRLLKSYKLNENVFLTTFNILQGLFFEWQLPTLNYPELSRGTRYFMATLAGGLIEAISESWRIPVKDLISSNILDIERGIKIGNCEGVELEASVLRIVKPADLSLPIKEPIA
jgi:hypothetical protein